MSYYREQLEDYLKTLDIKADSVLDIGGSQLPIKGRTKSWDVKDYKIMDLEKPHQGNKVDIIFDIQNLIIEHNDNNYENFDIVFCLEVMEYINDPIFSLINILSLLKQNGLLYITFPTFYPLHNPYKEDCLRYTKYGILKLIEETGFEILEIIPRYMKSQSFELLKQIWKIEGMHPAREFNEHNILGYIIKAQKL